MNYVTVFAADVPDVYRPVRYLEGGEPYYLRSSIAHHLFVGDLISFRPFVRAETLHGIIIKEDGGDRILVMVDDGLIGAITVDDIDTLNGYPIRSA